MTSSPRRVMTRRCSLRSPRSLWLLLKGQSRPDDVLRSPRRLRHCPSGQSWPDDVFRSLRELICDFISKVNHDRTMFCVVHVDYVLVSELNDSSSWLMWTMSLSTMLIMTRRPDDQLIMTKSLFLYFTISFVYLLQTALQIAASSFAEGFSERRLIAESSSHESLSCRERECHHCRYQCL